MKAKENCNLEGGGIDGMKLKRNVTNGGESIIPITQEEVNQMITKTVRILKIGEGRVIVKRITYKSKSYEERFRRK